MDNLATAIIPTLGRGSHNTEEGSEKTGAASSLHEVEPGLQVEQPHRVDLSVDGMTCASCINTITALLSDIPGVSDIVVSLLGKSATAVVQNRGLVPQLAEAIDDAGYEAVVVSIQPLQAGTSATDTPEARTLSLLVKGMSSQ
ncbi:hypothetical protein NUW54_g10983 [Trametes sanguinea]|uniref:Uncharacterized protein n=1 Tax=Trametes sanguinea TaxID=158606 RepID=A0ACC1NMR0_9APHY|nr:hypothetical protein NUW54_g10983 [Trametes sanguinea]